jgi:hypothetical protein
LHRRVASGDIFSPAAVGGDVAVDAFGKLARKENALYDSSIMQGNGAAVEAGRFTGLETLQYVVWYAI